MKEENTNEQSPLIKDNLPEVMYPGVTVEKMSNLSPKTAKSAIEKQKEQAEKNLVGSIIFRVLYVLNLYFMAGIFYKFVLTFSEMEKAGVASEIISILFCLFLFLVPLIFTVFLSGFTRLLIGCSAGKDVIKYISIMEFFSCSIKLVFVGFVGGTFFIPSLVLSAFMAKSILTYNGGGFLNHCKNILKPFSPKNINLFTQLFNQSKK